MKIQPTENINFRCHKATTQKLRDYGKVIKDTGFINGKKLEIYSAYSYDGQLMHKLYYLADNLGNWLKSKLKYYEKGKCYKVIRSEKKC